MSALDLSCKTHLTRFYQVLTHNSAIYIPPPHAAQYLTYVVSVVQPRLLLYFVITTASYTSSQPYGDTASGHCLVGLGVTKLRFYFIPYRERQSERDKISNIRLCHCSKNANVSHPLLLIKCRKFLLA